MEKNFSMEWNMERKIFSMEGRKLPVWNVEKSFSIPYHAQLTTQVKLSSLQSKCHKTVTS